MTEPLPVFRRRLDLRRLDERTVEAELEDAAHHVIARVEHDGERVTAVEGEAVRLPWLICPEAAANLAELVGTPVGETIRVDDMREHCTHLLECALAAIRYAGTDAPDQRYEVTVEPAGEIEIATARRDDGIVLELWADMTGVVGPEPYRTTLGSGFRQWAESTIGRERLEHALLLRRALWMRYLAAMDLDDYDLIIETGIAPGSCYSSQPVRLDRAVRNRGSSRPFS